MWPQVTRNDTCWHELNRNESTSKLEGASGVWLSVPLETDQWCYLACTVHSGTRGERETKVILKTAGGEPWTVRHQRQHTLGRDQKVGPKQKEMVGSIHGPGIHKEWKGISISITSMWFLVFYSPKLRWQG